MARLRIVGGPRGMASGTSSGRACPISGCLTRLTHGHQLADQPLVKPAADNRVGKGSVSNVLYSV